MRILAFMNQKGGVGKTTTTVNVGAALARLGKKVCLIDLDPQAHLTINYGIEPATDHKSLYDVLVNDTPLMEAAHTAGENISVVPSSIDLAGVEIELVSVPGRELVLKTALADAKADFDYVLFDCPPSLGMLTINALAAADDVIIPMQPHFLSLQGMAKLLQTIQLVQKRMNPRLRVAGVVLTMFDAQAKLSQEIISELNAFLDQAKDRTVPWSGAEVFQTRIRRNIKLAESPSFGQTIFDYDAACNGAADYQRLAEELVRTLNGEVAPTAASIVSETVAPPALSIPV